MSHRSTSPRLPLFTAALAGACAVALTLGACGGGGSDAGTSSGTGLSGASAGATSSGTITAFGSVFVNGHEFDTSTATVVDDDTGSSSSEALEVGMVVDVKAASRSRADRPVAGEVHLHALARGVVDASDATAGTLTVMGQTVQLTAATLFSDHRACVSSSTAPCAAVTGQSGLDVTTSGAAPASTTAGSYVSVHGYLFASGTAGAGAQIIATLVSVGDAPTSGGGPNYKAEGVVTAVDRTANALTIGGLTVDLSHATCYKVSSDASCAAAFSTGQVVSAYAAAVPATLPVTALSADRARARSQTLVETAGASIEIEGRVSRVDSAASTFVLRGVTVDASGLTGVTLPAVGDELRVLGTVASSGTTVKASSITPLHVALGAPYGLEGAFTAVTAGASAGSYLLQLLGQSVVVDAGTRLSDRSVSTGRGSASQSFNINTFQSYLAASASKHLRVAARKDSAGTLHALSVTLVPASTVASLSGVVDATPVPANAGSTSGQTTFDVLGVPVTAAPSAIVSRNRRGGGNSVVTVAAGDLVLVRGVYGGGTLVVAAPATGSAPAATAIVIDAGAPTGQEHDCFF